MPNALPRRPLLPLCCALAVLPATLPAQQPDAARPRGSEVAAFRILRDWLRRADTETVTVHGLGAAVGYDALVLGNADAGMPARGTKTHREQTFAIVLVPRSDDTSGRRLLFGNRTGRIFAGTPAEPREAGWVPDATTIASPGARAHVNDMLARGGTAQDGTEWKWLQPETAEQTAEVVDARGAPVDGAKVEVGRGRFAWFPGTVRLERAFALRGETGAEGKLRAEGIAADEVLVSVEKGTSMALLLDGDVVRDGNHWRIRVADGAWTPTRELTDVAWAAEALRLLHQEQVRHRAEHGAFGLPDDVVGASRRHYKRIAQHRFLFRGHLFQVWLHDGKGGAPVAGHGGGGSRGERYVAIAWPAKAGMPGARALAIDPSGAVHGCETGGAYLGHDLAPSWDAPLGNDGLADGTRGRDGHVWRRLR